MASRTPRTLRRRYTPHASATHTATSEKCHFPSMPPLFILFGLYFLLWTFLYFTISTKHSHYSHTYIIISFGRFSAAFYVVTFRKITVATTHCAIVTQPAFSYLLPLHIHRLMPEKPHDSVTNMSPFPAWYLRYVREYHAKFRHATNAYDL